MPTCITCHELREDQHFRTVTVKTAKGVETRLRGACRRCESGKQADRRAVARAEKRIAGPMACASPPESLTADIELGPAGVAPIAPVTPEEAHRAAPEGYAVKGVSTLYGADGEVKAQWVKTRQEDVDRMALLEKALTRITDPFRGASDPAPAPEYANEDLLCVIPFGDPHIGMYAWAAESGEDFNLEIAERNMVAAVDHLIALAPPAATLLLLNLGDYLHGDDPSNRTARSGAALDIDTRWSKVIGVGIRAMRRCVDRGLERFRQVINFNVGGNHDTNSAVMLRHVMQALYEREPRVTVDMTPGGFHWHRFGASLIGATHGDTAKLTELAGIMACDRPQDWGETKYRHWYTGHVHHDQLKEYPGVIVESFRTLAPKDSWHAKQGYRSGQDLKLDVFHRQWGRINRHVVGIEQVMSKAT